MKIKAFLFTLGFATLLLCSGVAHAAGGRHALVIGNGGYLHALGLPNPVNDASAVATRLGQAGFKVLLAKDTSVRDFLKALEQFKEQAAGAEAAVFYYAGHGVEVEGQNFLVPVDATLESKVDLELESVPLGRVIERMDEAKMTLKVVVLDCCRDNPFATRSWLRSRTGSRGGLAAVDERSLAEGTMLVYAGAPGEAVPDGEAAHSPFTTALLQQLQPGRSITTLFSDVALNVKGSEPWIKIDGSGRSFAAFSRYMLIPGEASAAQVVAAQPPPPLTTPVAPMNVHDAPPSAASVKVPLPATGFFSLDQLFAGTPYDIYNAQTRRSILNKAQQKFKDTGLYTGQPDGNPGPATQTSIIAWQRVQGMEVSGRLDKATLSALGLTGIAEDTRMPIQHKKTESSVAPRTPARHSSAVPPGLSSEEAAALRRITGGR